MKIALTLLLSLALLTRAEPEAGLPSPGTIVEGTQVGASNTSVEDERGIIALDQALREITNPFTVLCIAARPGDEDDGTLALVRKKLGARAVMLFATRGE